MKTPNNGLNLKTIADNPRKEKSMVKFSVDVHENGIVLTLIGLGAGPSKVFEKDHIEDALLEMYHLCSDWKVGDRIKIEHKSS